MFCGYCRKEISAGTAFCPYCGQKNHENQPAKKKRKKWPWIILIVMILAIMIGGLLLFFFLNKESDEEKNYDENNIGEVYFYQTEEEHIAGDEGAIQYADNEILLVAKEGTSYKQIEKLAESYDAEIVGWIEQTGDYQLKFMEEYSLEGLEGIADDLAKEKHVLLAYVNYIFPTAEHKTESRNGFIYGDEWEDDLQNFNNCRGKSWGLEAIETLAAWDILDNHSEEVTPVRVGLIDGGFDADHEDLGFAEIFYNTESAHGTHVAGTMAAKANNDQGICGVYPYGDGNLYGVSCNGACDYSENKESLIYMKIAYAELILRNVKVINSSWGYEYKEAGLSNTGQEWEEQVAYLESNAYILGDFLNRLLDKGYDFVLVQAAGNDSDRATNIIYDSKYAFWTTVVDREDYPEVYDRIIVVGAVAPDFSICNFSNGGERVDIYAPGEQIFSTIPDNGYGSEGWSGTSMAAPHVSGVAAMVWSVNNDLTGSQVKEIVCRRGSLKCTSCKMVDAYMALEAAVRTNTDSEGDTTENGGILCWVVAAEDETVKIENALVTATNVSTGESESTTTDVFGHFELILPDGEYTLTVQADGYQDYTWPGGNEDFTNPIVVRDCGVNYLEDWIKMESNALSEEELLAIMQTASGQLMEEHVYLDMDGDGTNEMLGAYADSRGIYHTWYCSSDGTVCKLVHQVTESAMEACNLELLEVDDAIHVAVNVYRLMGTVKYYSILALKDEEITCIVSNAYGYVYTRDTGDICLSVEAYDGMYDPSIDSTIVHTWKDTYLYYDGTEYKEYGATTISDLEFLNYENAEKIKQEIERELSASDVEKILYSYYVRSNGIMHIQCNVYRTSGEIDFGYYTLRYSENILYEELGERNSGQMSTSFSGLEVTF